MGTKLIHLDVETYSEIDLRASGIYPYAEHESTDVIMLWYRLEAEGLSKEQMKPKAWSPGFRPPKHLFESIRQGFMVVAHNCPFDAELWRQVLAKKYGWDWPGYDVFIDSMAAACMTNLPAKLEMAAKFFPGGVQKDKDGHALMLKMCKPAKPILGDNNPRRLHTLENRKALSNYCRDDVLAEQGFFSQIPALTEREDAVWRATYRMNRRGVLVDQKLVHAALDLAHKAQDRYRAELSKVTGGDVDTETQRGRLCEFLTQHGAELPRTEKGNYTLGKSTRYLVDEGMEGADELAHKALKMYDTLNKSSVSKYNKILSCLCTDGRIRGMFTYAGAGQTGRWAGRDVQLQNLPRGILEGDRQYSFARDLVSSGTCIDEVELMYGNAMDLCSSLIRCTLIASPGNSLCVADYSAVEGRGLAWAAGEEHILQAYRENKRMYAVAAAPIFNCSYEQIMQEKANGNSKKDKTGKVAELACGYQGGVGAFVKMGGRELGMDEARMKQIVTAWREDRAKTVQFWHDMEAAAMTAIRCPGEIQTCGIFAFGYGGRDLKMKLPSGRCLWYRRARIGEKKWPNGGTSPQIQYYGIEENRIGWISTYGGKLVENAIQAMCRDMLADAMLRAEAEGWPLIMTVHDELVADSPRHHEELCQLMADLPDWCKTMPIDAAGFTGQFYRKD